MGYTHYWNLDRDSELFYVETWEQVADLCERCLFSTLVPLAGWDGTGAPEWSGDIVRFNGVADDSHETFMLSPYATGFNFCKTERKPYDEVVVACLLAAKYVWMHRIELNSDGIDEQAAFSAGARLFEYATGNSAPAWDGAMQKDSTLHRSE